MSKFPRLGKIDESIVKLMETRGTSNFETSKLLAWMRISSAYKGGLSIESVPKDATFDTTYGNTNRSGRVGVDFAGVSVYAEPDRTLRPSPTIDSMSLVNNARGLSRKASFSITCYTLAQLEKLSPYFLEPGYTVLIEYGWNIPKSHAQRPDLSKKGPCKIASYNQFATVLNKRIDSGGTYDGFMGYITGGGIKAGDNQTWIIDVDVTTLGEIPAYLQTNRTSGAQKIETQETALTYSPSDVDDEDDPGKQLFMMMYNRLPAGKRTDQMKKMMDTKDIRGVPFSDVGNYVNIHPDLPGALSTSFEGKNLDGAAKIPNGSMIFSDHSFIRLELAFKIIQDYILNLSATIAAEGCTDLTTQSFLIEANNTICRGHKWMFSTDPSVLYVPNTNLPDFGLMAALSNDTASNVTFVELDPTTGVPTKDPIDGNPFKLSKVGTPTHYSFPSPDAYSSGAFPDIDSRSDVSKLETDAYQWGYLRNLYVNLDFFIEVLGKANYVAKDCYYDLLNGISGAVNALWNFQIITADVPIQVDGKWKTKTAVTVIDESFTGKLSKPFLDSVPSFTMSGVTTPFMSANLSIDIPSAMQNSILGKRNSAKKDDELELTTEGQTPDIKYIFADDPDPVMAILNSLRSETDSHASGDDDGKTPDKSDENRKASVNLFLGTGTVLPFVADAQDVTDANTGWWDEWSRRSAGYLQNIMIVGVWGDCTLLKRLETVPYTEGDEASDGSAIDPMLLPITFEFELHGFSGLQLGDVFKIIDLPKRYKKSILQVTKIDHKLSGMQWITSVTAQMRNTG